MHSIGFLPGALFLLVLTALAASPSLAAITNRTIDDTKGDSVSSQRVIYQPTSGVWNNVACPLCAIRPDFVQAFEGTWTEATYFKQSKDPISATMSFTGTAIYVYFILANNLGTVITKTAANFTLDNQPPKLFEHPPDMSRSDLQYNALVFSQTNLENTHHSLVISISGIQEQVYINFDYAIYTFEDVVVTPTVQTTASMTTQQSVATSPQPSASASKPTSNSIVTSTPPGSVASAGSSVTASSPASASPPNSGTAAAGSQSTNIVQTSNTVFEKSSTPVGAIAGGVVGGLVVIALLIIGLILIRRRRGEDDKYDNRNKIDSYGSEAKEAPYPGHRRDASNTTTVVPFPPPSTVQLSDTTAASDGVNPYGGISSISSGATGAQGTKGRMEDLRRARQEELEQRLQSTQQEMREILNEIDRHGAGIPPGLRPLPTPGQQGSHRSQSQATLAGWGLTTTTGGEVRYSAAPTEDQMTTDELKETLREMRAQVEYLHQQQQSAWAQGLSDEPPPGYSAITRALSLRRSQS